MTSFVMTNQLGIVAAAIVLAVTGLTLHVLDVRRDKLAGRRTAEEAAAWAEVLTPAEIEEILADRRTS